MHPTLSPSMGTPIEKPTSSRFDCFWRLALTVEPPSATFSSMGEGRGMLEPAGLLACCCWKGIAPRRSRLGVPRRVLPEMVPPDDMVKTGGTRMVEVGSRGREA